jgi:putative transposase
MKRTNMSHHSHSVSILNYHLVLVVKYRRKVIDDSVSSELKTIFENISNKYHIELIEWNHDKDHIHVLIKASPIANPALFINVYKSCSSRIIKIKYPGIRRFLWKEFFWSRSCFLATVGGAPLSVLKRYIENQGK